MQDLCLSKLKKTRQVMRFRLDDARSSAMVSIQIPHGATGDTAFAREYALTELQTVAAALSAAAIAGHIRGI
jgi:hypothetical protein